MPPKRRRCESIARTASQVMPSSGRRALEGAGPGSLNQPGWLQAPARLGELERPLKQAPFRTRKRGFDLLAERLLAVVEQCARLSPRLGGPAACERDREEREARRPLPRK